MDTEKKGKNGSRPLILISNDDGVNSLGLRALIECVSDIADVVAVAPMEQHSGQSSAITVTGPLRIKDFGDYKGAKMYGVSGTPVDCVKLSMHRLLPRRPDIMLSGINHGSNAGCNNIYSGTMGAAMETCMAGIPSIGFSLLSHDPNADFSQVLTYARDIIMKVLEGGLPEDVCLNVNMPAGCKPHGVKVVRAARGHWTDEYQEYLDPAGHPFYWITGRFINDEPGNEETDEYWLAKEYVTVVPVRPDQSDVKSIPDIETLLG